MYLPASFKTMLKWCRYYFLTNPTINTVVYKMAEYPVTDLILDDDNKKLAEKWSTFFKDTVHFKKFLVEVGLDYGAYGNAFVSIHYPFHKYLVCKNCGHAEKASKQKYKFRSFKFEGECNRCGHHGEFKQKDMYVASYRDVRMIRWNPEHITIQHNDATEESLYYYKIPAKLQNDIRLAKRHVLENIPKAFISAVEKNKALLFNRDNIYHMKRPTIADKDKGWGLPMILPVLKDVYYLQILRKAQEAIAVEHAVPLRILFPSANSASSDPYSTVNLNTWKAKIESEIMRWRLDNNYIPVMPVPVGSQSLGGDGRALMLAQEYRVWEETIITGMGVPIEFVKGGLSFSGSSVSLRMLENHFLDQKADHEELAHFIMEKVGAFLGWQPIKNVRFKRFKMADDLQRSAFNLQLNQSAKISDRSLLEESDWDADQESERIEGETKRRLEAQRKQALGQASIQGESQLAMSKYQLKAQKLMQQAEADAMMMQQQQQEAQQMPMVSGIPGEAGPMTMGQEQIAQQGMMNQTGLVPSVDVSQMAQMQQQQQGMMNQQQQQMDAKAMAGQPQQPMPQPTQQPAQPAGPMPAVQSTLTSEHGPQLSLAQTINSMVAALDQMPAHEQQAAIQRLGRFSPDILQEVVKALAERRGAHQSSTGMPMPQQRTPRRGPEAVAA
jgi:hypothetical protein